MFPPNGEETFASPPPTPNTPCRLEPSQPPNLGVKLVEGHDGPEEEVGEVEVVFEQVREGVAAFLAVTVLQCKAHAAHDAEPTAAVEQDVLQVERTGDQRFLQEGVCTLHVTYLSSKKKKITPSSRHPFLSTHLPGVIRLQLDGGQRGKTRCEAHQLTLEPADAVEDEAVRQNQSHEGPAHCDQDCQTAVQPEDQGPALWVQRSRVTVDVATRSLHAQAAWTLRDAVEGGRVKTDGVSMSSMKWDTTHVREFTSLFALPYIHLHPSSFARMEQDREHV